MEIIIAITAILGTGYYFLTKNDKALKKGIKLYDLKKYNEALTIFLNLKSENFSKAEIWFERTSAKIALNEGILLFEQNKYTDAKNRVSGIKDPDKITLAFYKKCIAYILYSEAKTHFDKGEFKKAISIINGYAINPAYDLQRLCEANLTFKDAKSIIEYNQTRDNLNKSLRLFNKVKQLIPEANDWIDKVKKELNFIDGVDSFNSKKYTEALSFFEKATNSEKTRKFIKLTEQELTLINVITAYNNKNYDESIKLLNSLSPTFKSDEQKKWKKKTELEIVFEFGKTQFENKKFNLAKSTFSGISEAHKNSKVWLDKTNNELELISGIKLFNDQSFEEALKIFNTCKHNESSKWITKANDEITYKKAKSLFDNKEYKQSYHLLPEIIHRLYKAKKLSELSKAHFEFNDGKKLFEENNLNSYKSALLLFRSSTKLIKEANKWIKKTETELNYLYGISKYDEGDFETALKLLEKAKSKKNCKAIIKKARVEIKFNDAKELFKSKKLEQSLELFNSIKDSHRSKEVLEWIDKTNIEIRFNEGVTLFNKKKFAASETIFEEVKNKHEFAKEWLERAKCEVLFAKGLVYFEKGKLLEALDIFTKSKHVNADEKKLLVEDEIHFLKGIELYKSNKFENALLIFKDLSSRVIKAKEWVENSNNEIRYLNALQEFERKNYIKSIEFLKTIVGNHDAKDELFNTIVRTIFEDAKLAEKETKLAIALKLYNIVLEEQEYLNGKQIINEVNCRILITKIKLGDTSISESKIASAKCNKRNVKLDLQYRWICSLYDNKQFESLAKYLPKYFEVPNLEVDLFTDTNLGDKEINKNILLIYNEIRQFYYQELNNQIDLLNRYTKVDFNFSNGKKIYKDFQKNYIDILNKISSIKEHYILSDIEVQNLPKYSVKLKDKFFNELMKSGINEGQYSTVLNFIISEKPKYYNQIELINNVAICSAMIASEGKLNRLNYKKVISNWLTAVYIDDLIVHSLINTSWDDNYTFSIYDTIGWLKNQDLIKENVISKFSNDALSIGESQKELIRLFENCLSDSNYSTDVLAFYKDEKKSLSELLNYKAILGENSLIGTPYFLSKIGEEQKIVTMLVKQYTLHSDSDILYLAKDYSLGVRKNKTVKEFNILLTYEDKLIKCFRNLDSTSLKKLKSNYAQISYNEFPDRIDAIQNKLFDIFIGLQESNGYSIKLWNAVVSIFSLIPNSEKFKHSFADFTNKMIVTLLNNKNISRINSMKYLLKSINVDSNNQTRENLKAVIHEFILTEVSDDSHFVTSEELGVIYKVVDLIGVDEISVVLFASMLTTTGNNSTKDLLKKLQTKHPYNKSLKEIEADVIIQNSINKSNDGSWDTKKVLNEMLRASSFGITDRFINNFPIVFENLFHECIKVDITLHFFNNTVKNVQSLNNDRLNRELRTKYRRVKAQFPPEIDNVMEQVRYGITDGYTSEAIRWAKTLNAFKEI